VFYERSKDEDVRRVSSFPEEEVVESERAIVCFFSCDDPSLYK